MTNSESEKYSSSGRKKFYFTPYAKSDSVSVDLIDNGVAGGSISSISKQGVTTINNTSVCEWVEFTATVNKKVSLNYAVGVGSMIPQGAYISHPNSQITVRFSWNEFREPPEPPEPPEPATDLQGPAEDYEHDYKSYTLEEWEEKVLLKEGINEKCRHADSYNEWGEIVSPPIINPFISSVVAAQRVGENAIFNSMKCKNISLSIPPFFEIKPRKRIKIYLGSDIQSEVSERVERIEINQKGKNQEFIIDFKAESGQYYEPKDFKLSKSERLTNLKAEIERYNEITRAAKLSTKEGENLKFAKVEVPHPDDTYDVKLLGLNESLKKVPKNRNIEINFLEGDTVLVRFSYGSNDFAEIAAAASFEFPDEHLHEFNETPEPVSTYSSQLFLVVNVEESP